MPNYQLPAAMKSFKPFSSAILRKKKNDSGFIRTPCRLALKTPAA
jgi:hypothetical protein